MIVPRFPLPYLGACPSLMSTILTSTDYSSSLCICHPLIAAKFDPNDLKVDMTGKVVIITGANKGR